MNPSVKTGKAIAGILSLWLISALPVHADSPVWRIEKNGNQLFLGGSFHMLSPGDYPLPAAFDDAYSRSAKVVFETDLEKLQAPEYQQSMLRQLSYADGRNLRQVLTAETYRAVAEFFAARGIPMDNINNLKPGMVAMTMMIVELQRLGLVGVGVDAYYSKKTVADQKKRGQLESVEQQLEFISNMGAGREDEMLVYNLADLKKLPAMLHSLKAAWRNGDMIKLEEIAAAPLENDFPELYQSILVNRNEAWMPLLEALFNNKEIEFVLVGALHLAGDEGLLAKFSAAGYTIKQLP